MRPPRLASVSQNCESILAGGSTVTELVESFLSRITAAEDQLNAFCSVDREGALQEAGNLDDRVRSGETVGPLLGTVASIKDIIDVAGVPTTCCSPSRVDTIASCDAAIVRSLKAAGTIVIGKANCHEFAFGGPAFDLPFPPARNPWNTELFPGGSSSGSGVTVAAGFCNLSLGTDTAGSIRLPSTHCGLTGLKPTYGAVPMAGIQPLSLTMDSAGPIARTVEDCRLAFEVICNAGVGSENAESRRWRTGNLKGLRVGLADASWGLEARFDADVGAEYERVIDVLGRAGADIIVLELPSLQRIHASSSVTMMAEVASIYASEVKRNFSGFGEVFRARALAGETLTTSHYLQACQERARLAAGFTDLFSGVDVLLMPGAVRVAGPIKTVDKFYFVQEPNINVVANFTGCPALALPTNLSVEGIPMGIQLMGPPHREARLLDVGQGIETLLSFRQKFVQEDLATTRRGNQTYDR